jgi:TolB-like protein
VNERDCGVIDNGLHAYPCWLTSSEELRLARVPVNPRHDPSLSGYIKEGSVPLGEKFRGGNGCFLVERKSHLCNCQNRGQRDQVSGSTTISSTIAELPRHQLGWRMAVLPFRSAGAPIGLGIALGMAEEVSAALCHYRAPRLIATATFWDGSGPADDAFARCRAYHLDYIVTGTIQVEDDKVLVNVELLDVVLDFEVIWNGRFEGQLNNLFSLQHQIAFDTVTQVDPELFHRGAVAEARVRTEIAAAHQSLLTAIQGIFRLDRTEFMRARTLLARAIELDPDYAAAHGWMAYWSLMAVGLGWVDDPRDVTTLAGTSAERAVLLDPLDARAIAIAGHVKGYLLHDVQSALHLHARAIELNPNLPIAWTLSSWSKIYNGEHAAAVRHATMALSLSPRDPHIFLAEHALMTAQFFNHNLEEAERLAELVLQRTSGHASALNVRLAILGHMARREEARNCLAALRNIDPNVTIDRIVSRPPLRHEDKAFYIDGLERAGVPRGELAPAIAEYSFMEQGN